MQLSQRSQRLSLASIPSQINSDKEESSEDETWYQEAATKYSTVELSYDEDKDEDKDKDKEVYNKDSDLESESYEDKKEKGTSLFASMSLFKFRSSSLKVEYPFMAYTFVDERQKRFALTSLFTAWKKRNISASSIRLALRFDLYKNS